MARKSILELLAQANADIPNNVTGLVIFSNAALIVAIDPVRSYV